MSSSWGHSQQFSSQITLRSLDKTDKSHVNAWLETKQNIHVMQEFARHATPDVEPTLSCRGFIDCCDAHKTTAHCTCLSVKLQDGGKLRGHVNFITFLWWYWSCQRKTAVLVQKGCVQVSHLNSQKAQIQVVLAQMLRYDHARLQTASWWNNFKLFFFLKDVAPPAGFIRKKKSLMSRFIMHNVTH